MLTQEQIEKAIAEAIEARHQLHYAALAVARIKDDLTYQETQVVALGKVEGKNQAERDANLYQMFSPQHEALTAQEANLAHWKAQWDVAQLRLDSIRYVLRLMELVERDSAEQKLPY